MPKRGLEPPRLAALVPKTSAYTNFATSAFYSIIYMVLAWIVELFYGPPAENRYKQYII